MRYALFVVILATSPLLALEPKNVFIVSNKNVPASRDVAAHYVAVRKVPKENVVELDLPTGEDISRADYDAKLAGPLREALKAKQESVKVLLTVYGVPLRVGAQQPNAKEAEQLKEIRTKLTEVRKELADLEKADPKDMDKIKAAKQAVDTLVKREPTLTHSETLAAVDSELMLLWVPDYSLDRFYPNPLYRATSGLTKNSTKLAVMTSRLDGPTPAIAMRLVDDAIEVEKTGLKGKVYVDARGMKYDAKKSGTGYEGYDESYREMAALLKAGGMEVTLDDKSELFKPGTCPDAALYSGWYSHANFIDSNKFVKGAVAWHLASSEATTLRNDKSKVWCPNLLKAGVAATIGPVAEPYTLGFPKPAEFFGLLATGKYTLVECYAKSVYFASWMGVLVGDPLYTPFAKDPVVKEEDVIFSPAGFKIFR